MKLVAAHQANREKVEAFLATTQHVDRESLLKDGYVVEFGQEIKGCFVLSPLEEGGYWLRQLHIAKEAAGNLPVLLETIVVIAKQKEGRKLYVHSHQPVVDILLEALQFHRQNHQENVDKIVDRKGNWWTYDVS